VYKLERKEFEESLEVRLILELRSSSWILVLSWILNALEFRREESEPESC